MQHLEETCKEGTFDKKTADDIFQMIFNEHADLMGKMYGYKPYKPEAEEEPVILPIEQFRPKPQPPEGDCPTAA